MQDVVPCTPEEPFLFWLRFEWGNNGNPHAHGKNYVSGNPSYECIVEDEDTRQEMILHGHSEAHKLQTKDEAETALGGFFDQYVTEWHPSKDDDGSALHQFAFDINQDAKYQQPQCIDLLELLDEVFTDDVAPNLLPLQKLLVALIEDGQRHSWHGRRAPVLGCDACARKGSARPGKDPVYSRYLFPRLLRLLDSLKKAVVEEDEHRPGLYNLFFSRKYDLLNPFEEHLLMCNLGNIDWRALLNLWSVFEYLIKYSAKAGTGSGSFQKTFVDVTKMIATSKMTTVSKICGELPS